MLKKQFDATGTEPGEGGGVAPIAPALGNPEPLPEPELGLTSASTTIAVIERQPQSWGWLKIGLAACCSLGGIAGAALLWMLSLPPAVDCQQISALSPDMDRLYCVQEAARSGEVPKLVAGMKSLEQWTPDNPLYEQAQRSLAEWSSVILGLARQRMEQSDYAGAMELAKQIPPSSPIYADVQAEMQRWQGDWRQFERVFAAAQQALQQQAWDRALNQIVALRESNFEHWRTAQANALADQLTHEKQARKLLNQARSLAQRRQPEQLSAAIALLSQIHPQTFTWKEAQPNLKQWSENLLAVGFQQLQQGRLSQAIALGKRAALNPVLAPEAENLIWLSHASQLRVASVVAWKASPIQIVQMIGAIAIAAQVPPTSRFYAAAQTSLKDWRQQLQHVSQLQLAQLAANLGHPATLRWAAAQARQVPSHTQQRLQAQTLIAYWTHEAERLEDRPTLTTARQLAEQGTIASLQAAIAQAQLIRSDRTLYGEAQGLSFAWQQQVQVLQDQPLLDRARSLATQGKLSQAMQAAAQIRPGRALFLDAQAIISDAEAQVRAAQTPRPLRDAEAPFSAAPRRQAPSSAATSRPAAAGLDAAPTDNLDREVFSEPTDAPAAPPPEQVPASPDPAANPVPANTTPLPVAAPEPIAPAPSVTVPTEPVAPIAVPVSPAELPPAAPEPAAPTYAPAQAVPLSANPVVEASGLN